MSCVSTCEVGTHVSAFVSPLWPKLNPRENRSSDFADQDVTPQLLFLLSDVCYSSR